MIANLVVGASGQSTCNGRSAGLSSPSDRTRFHELRQSANVILIGGHTARTEPYSTTPVRLIVLTRTNEIPERIRQNPLSEIWNSSPQEAIARLNAEKVGTILIEGGARFLQNCLANNLVDALYVTQLHEDKGENPVDISLLTRTMKKVSEENLGAESYLQFQRCE